VAHGIGDVTVSMSGRLVHLKECLWVPKISQQLLSLVHIIKESVTISINKSTFSISDGSSLLFSGRICDNLLYAWYSSPSALLSKSHTVNYTTWHHRLGHPGENIMKLMDLPISDVKELCEVCACSKMTLMPFPSHFSKVHSPLDCLHMDLIGPITPHSVSGFKYVLTVVDQFSSFKFVRFLKAKSDTFEEFEKLAKLIENVQQLTIKEIVSNGGGEFVNHKFKHFTTSRGIGHIVSPPETPEHNGYAERANRTILNKAQALLMTSGLPNSFWAKAVNSSNFLSVSLLL
jgi:hypothetical protein